MSNDNKYILFLISLLLLLSGCKNDSGTSKTLEAEYIKYNVVYLEDMAGDIPTKMLPDIMEAYYTDKYIMTQIKGFFGQFSLVQVANLKKNSVTTMLNFFGNKVAYHGKRGEIPAGIKALDNPEIEYTSETVTVCNMLSHKAVIKTSDDIFNIYYIQDIEIKDPNITTPYNFIDYVLSDFRVQLSMLKMHLTMYQHKEIEVDTEMFMIPDDYVEVSKDSMESIINSLFTKE